MDGLEWWHYALINLLPLCGGIYKGWQFVLVHILRVWLNLDRVIFDVHFSCKIDQRLRYTFRMTIKHTIIS
jgi:hypothetical protein